MQRLIIRMVPLLLYTSLDYKLDEILGNAKADLTKNKLIWTNENNIGNIKAQVMSKDIDYIYNPTTNTPEYGPYNTEFKINDYIPANGADKDTPLFVVVDPPKNPCMTAKDATERTHGLCRAITCLRTAVLSYMYIQAQVPSI